ncbi:MAG: isoamylase early set domain-containing protein [Saprospiraceae bacterium]|nr:isoamylase early set domain-containing protein [Saprospiraceae bacterium]
MSLKKKYLKSKPVCKVTFNLPKDEVAGGKQVALVGEFNNWKPKKADHMRKLKNGTFTKTIDLEVGKSYQFRYLIDGETWVNDPAADAYVSSGVSHEENCIVTV